MKKLALILTASCLVPSHANAQASAGTLLGDDVRVQVFNYSLSGTATVTHNIEFENYWGPPVFEQNLKKPRWSLDITANKVIVEISQPSTYGNGYYMLFDDLDPSIPGCNGGGKIASGTISTTDPTATFVTANLVVEDHAVQVPLGPVGGHTWPGGARVEVALTFACNGPMTGNLQNATAGPVVNPANPPSPPPPATPAKKKKKGFFSWLFGK